MRKLLTLSCQREEEKRGATERGRGIKKQETETKVVKHMTWLMERHPQVDFLQMRNNRVSCRSCLGKQTRPQK